MIKIQEFAFCFLSNNIDDVIRQEIELTKLSNKYQIERWYRYDRYSGMYTSFSQMANDAIDDTDSEFMIFCNPKTHFIKDDIEFIIEKLSNGYCFASVVNFGFFGMSKELIRNIGMMDERFIGGEYEDNDFLIRLNHFKKAIYNGYELDKYKYYESKSHTLRNLSISIYNQKYFIYDKSILKINSQLNIENDDNIIYIDENFFNHKKISKRHRKTNQIIYDSWLGPEYNFCNPAFLTCVFNKTILVNPKIEEKIVDFNFTLTRDFNNYHAELNCLDNIILFIIFLDKNRITIWKECINNNAWKTFSIFSDDVEIRIFLGDNQIYNAMINPTDKLKLNLRIPTIVKSF